MYVLVKVIEDIFETVLYKIIRYIAMEIIVGLIYFKINTILSEYE